MHNELLKIGPVTVYGYGLMIAIGIILCYILAERRAKARGLAYDQIFFLAIFCLIFGAIGSKVLYILTVLDKVIENPAMLLNFGDGWVLYGGIIGGIFGGWLFCKIKKFDFYVYFDLVMVSVVLAQAFGRLGCFLAGCCYGAETDLPIGITFTNSAYAPNGVSLLPTQLMSSFFDFALCLVLYLVARKTTKRGIISGLYCVCYSIGRFIVEFMRGDLERGSVGALSTSQFIALFILAAGIIILVLAAKDKLPGRKAVAEA